MYVMDNYYTPSELVRLASSTIRTRLFYPGALLVRNPIVVRGKPRMRFGKGFTTGYHCRLETFGSREDREPRLVFGRDCHIGDYVHIAAADFVELGDECLLASHIFISDLDHGSYGMVDATDPGVAPNDRPLQTSPVHIGSRVWIGEGVSILKGVTIGDGSVIGAHSVVTSDVPANSVAVGAPSRVIKRFSPGERTWLPVRDGREDIE